MMYVHKGYYSIEHEFLVNGPQCTCGNRDWFCRNNGEWICSVCHRIQKVWAKGYIINGPLCTCGYRDWFVGKEIVRCTNCMTKIFIQYKAFVLDGPICKCKNRDWFESETVYKCSKCKTVIIK